MGCTDCFGAAKEVQATYSTIYNLAKQKAIETGIYQVIYKTESGELAFLPAGEAVRLNVDRQSTVSPIPEL